MFLLERIPGARTPSFLQTALMHTAEEAESELRLSYGQAKKPAVSFNPSQVDSCNVVQYVFLTDSQVCVVKFR